MQNPMLNRLNHTMPQSPQVASNGGNIFEMITKFQQDLAGKNPEQLVREKLESGEMSQTQFQQLRSQAQQIMPMLRAFMKR